MLTYRPDWEMKWAQLPMEPVWICWDIEVLHPFNRMLINVGNANRNRRRCNQRQQRFGKMEGNPRPRPSRRRKGSRLHLYRYGKKGKEEVVCFPGTPQLSLRWASRYYSLSFESEHWKSPWISRKTPSTMTLSCPNNVCTDTDITMSKTLKQSRLFSNICTPGSSTLRRTIQTPELGRGGTTLRLSSV